jgi:hypothetical protein
MKIAPRINSKGDVVFYTLALQWKNIHEMFLESEKKTNDNNENSRTKDSWMWFT